MLPVLLRDAQVLPIWEGTTNVLALDALLRADFATAAAALRSRVAGVQQRIEDPALRAATDAAVRAVDRGIAWQRAATDERALQAGARRLVLSLGRAFELALLAELADAAILEGDDRGAARRACLQFQAAGYFFV